MSITDGVTPSGSGHHVFDFGERRDVAAETDHRIANSLALIVSLVRNQARAISLEGRSLTSGEVSLLLQEVASRVDTVGRLHRVLSQAGDMNAEICSYIEEVCDGILSALSPAQNFKIVHIPAGACVVPGRQAAAIGLIVCEMVTNAIKYSHPTHIAGEVRVTCDRKPDGSLLVEVRDDGVGLPEGFNPAVDGGHGIRLVRGLAEQLTATYGFDDDGLGLAFRLHIPASEAVR